METMPETIYRLHLDITGKCNLRCVHCYASERYAQEIPLMKILKLISELKRQGLKKIAFSGGEPFLRKDIFQMIDACPMDVTILSNSLLIDDEIIHELKKREESGKHIFQLKISLDGLASHEKIRGVSAQIVIDKIKKLLNHEFIVGVNTTIMPFTLMKEVSEMYKILIELGVDDWRVDLPFNQGSAKINKLCNDWGNYADIVVDITKKYLLDRPEMAFDSVSLFSSDMLNEDYSLMKYCLSDNPCGYQFKSITVDANGNILMCPSIPYKLGSIYNDEIKMNKYRNSDIWKKYAALKVSDLSGCNNCKFKQICGGGCRANVFTGYQDSFYEKDDLSCYLMMRFEKDILPILPSTISEKYKEYMKTAF